MAMERKYCTMVKQEMRKIRITISQSKCPKRFSPYFFKSILPYVYTIKNSIEDASAITDANAAPRIPISGNPHFPNIIA